jgi:hypothetical protein
MISAMTKANNVPFPQLKNWENKSKTELPFPVPSQVSSFVLG